MQECPGRTLLMLGGFTAVMLKERSPNSLGQPRWALGGRARGVKWPSVMGEHLKKHCTYFMLGTIGK